MTSEPPTIRALESLLAKAEREYAEESRRVEILLFECGRDKVQPAKDYWHQKDRLFRKLTLLREMIGK